MKKIINFSVCLALAFSFNATQGLTTNTSKANTFSGSPVLVFEGDIGSANLKVMSDINGTLFFSTYKDSLPFIFATNGTFSSTRELTITGLYNNFIEFNSIAYFNDFAHILYRSDGTPSGTLPIKKFNSFNSGLIKVGNDLYFLAEEVLPSTVKGLWKSDGTVTGTVLIKSIDPHSRLTSVSNKIFFDAYGAFGDSELWVSDGTTAGTTLVKNIRAGGDDGYIFLGQLNGWLIFGANDGVNGHELWRSDGTITNTALIANINPTGDGITSSHAHVSGSFLYFVGDDGVNGKELWQTDGTTSGTRMVKNIGPLTSPGSGYGLDYPTFTGPANSFITGTDDDLFFAADDFFNGNELWKSDGTTTGTVLAKDIYSGTTGSKPDLFGTSKLVFFSADDGISGRELWVSDGTPSGTRQMFDLESGAVGSNPSKMALSDGVLYFATSAFGKPERLWALKLSPVFTSPTPISQTMTGTNYHHQFFATGILSSTYSVISGALPPGLVLTAGGVISGTSNTSGTYTVTVSANNGYEPNAEQTFAITVRSNVIQKFVYLPLVRR